MCFLFEIKIFPKLKRPKACFWFNIPNCLTDVELHQPVLVPVLVPLWKKIPRVSEKGLEIISKLENFMKLGSDFKSERIEYLNEELNNDIVCIVYTYIL